MSRKLKKLISQASEYLDEGEEVAATVLGAYETKILGRDSVRRGIILATDTRLVFYAKKTMGYDFEVFPYSNISSIEMSKGIMGRSISFFAAGNKAKMKWIKEGDVENLVAHVKSNMGKQSEPSQKASGLDDLEKLAGLKEKGIITEEEFEAKKKQLLGL